MSRDRHATEDTENSTEEGTEAVSPVIGVILMVAITVILAAVIGTFVLGLGEGVSATPSAGVTTDANPTEVSFTIVDPGNVDGFQVANPDKVRSLKIEETGVSPRAGVKITVRSEAGVKGMLDRGNVTIIEPDGPPAPFFTTLEVSSLSDLSGTQVEQLTASAEGYSDEAAVLSCLIAGLDESSDIPSGTLIPCHGPTLAQTPSVEPGTVAGEAPGPGPSKIFAPVTFSNEGDYQLIGEVNGDETLLRSIEVDEE